MAERLHFKTNVQLKSILGKDLINNDNIAVLELVKNSYDAGSNSVEVIFENLKKNDDHENVFYSDKSSKIFIKDYGIGMDDTDIKEKWLNIAYSEKRHEKELDGRVLAGAKGVGRFSCDRLGQYLDLYTKKNGKPIYHLFTDWKKFEVEDKKDFEIQKVDIELEEISQKEFRERFKTSIEQGTFLEISKLRSQWVTREKKEKKEEKWDTGKILDLRRYLEKLINPNQAFESKNFTIQLIAGEFKGNDAFNKESEKINGEIKNKIFEKLNFTTTVIESVIPPAGETITTTLTDKGQKVIEVVERNVQYSLLKDIKIVIFYLNPYAKAYFKRQTGIRSVDFGSIFLFINGFRVNPLGDSGDDWLRMEVRKGQGYSKWLGTREVVGRIEINDPRGDFKIISSREGVVKDQKFSQIVDIQPTHYKGFFYKTLKRLEKYVVEGLDWDSTVLKGLAIEKIVDDRNWEYDPANEKYEEDQSKKDERIMGLISSMILLETRPANILNLYINEELVTQLLMEEKAKAREKFNKYFTRNALYARDILDETTWEAINKVREELEEKKKELGKKEKILAKKEREIMLLKREKKELEKDIAKKDERVKELELANKEKQEQIYFLRGHVEASREYTHLLNLYHHVGISANTIETTLLNLQTKVSKGNFTGETIMESMSNISKTNRKISAIASIASKAKINFDTASLELTNENLTNFIIQYVDNVSKTFLKDYINIRLDQSQKYAGFINDFNSIEIIMLFDNLFSNARKAGAKTVTVEIISHSNELTIKIRDDGKGIPGEIVDKIFDFGFTTTYGTGLGLSHVKGIVKELGGEITVNQEYHGGSEFVITVKK